MPPALQTGLPLDGWPPRPEARGRGASGATSLRISGAPESFIAFSGAQRDQLGKFDFLAPAGDEMPHELFMATPDICLQVERHGLRS